MEYYKEIAHFEKEFKEYAANCSEALRLTVARIDNIKEAIARSDERNPFDSIHYRVKKLDSIIEKCKRRGYEINMESIKQNVQDIAGIRIITPFMDDIFTVVKMIRETPGIIITEEKDYVSNPKPNGYASYHLNVQVEIYAPLEKKSKLIPLEIQVRDKVMDTWAAIEHIIKYKNDNPSSKVEKMFKKMAENLRAFDNMAIELRDSNNPEDI